MDSIGKVKEAFESYRDDVKTKMAALSAKVDELKAAVDSGNATDAEISALAAEIGAAKHELDGTVQAPVSVPDSTPSNTETAPQQ